MRVKLYRVAHPSTPWMVRYLFEGRRVRRHFTSEAQAKDYARGLREKLQEHGTAALTIAAHEVLEFRQARDVLPPEFSLTEAVRFFLQHKDAVPVPRGPSVREAWTAFFESRLDRSSAYRTQLSSQCEPLLEAIGWPRQLSQVQPQECEAAIAAGKAATETRANRRRMLSTFTRWARMRYRLPGDPMESVRRWEVRRGSPRFYSVAQTQALLKALGQREPAMLPGLALRCFAGLREVELKRMVALGVSETDIRRGRARTILVRSEVAKASGEGGRGQPRLIEGLPPTLWRFVPAGPLWWPRNPAEILRPLFRQCGIEPIKNGFRHSFVTYAVAWYESMEKAALVAGHSTDVLAAHYRGLATRAQAKKYFAIKP